MLRIFSTSSYDRGTFLERPAATAVTAPFLYFAEDEGITYSSDGSAWTRVSPGGGEELAYAEKTDALYAPTTADGRKDIPGLATISFTVTAGTVVYVVAACNWRTTAIAGANGSIYVSDNAGVDAAAGIRATGPSNAGYTSSAHKLAGFEAVERIVTPGAYVRKGQAQSAVGTVNFLAGTGLAGAAPPITLRAFSARS